MILYGSYARGDYTEDSDIDIMVLLDLSDMAPVLAKILLNMYCQ